MPRSAGRHLLLVSQASYKQVSKQPVKSIFTTLYTSCLGLLLVQIQCTLPSCLWDFCFLTSFLLQMNPVLVSGRRHPGDSRSRTECLGQSRSSWGIYMQEYFDSQLHHLDVLAWLWEIRYSTILVGLTRLLAYLSSWPPMRRKASRILFLLRRKTCPSPSRLLRCKLSCVLLWKDQSVWTSLSAKKLPWEVDDWHRDAG